MKHVKIIFNLISGIENGPMRTSFDFEEVPPSPKLIIQRPKKIESKVLIKPETNTHKIKSIAMKDWKNFAIAEYNGRVKLFKNLRKVFRSEKKSKK